jgi:hypothetical protein
MTDWIEHKPGPCPIPDAKAGEYEIMWDNGEVAPLDVPPTQVSNSWKQGAFTHYRIIKPDVDWQAIADELVSALKAIHPDPHYDYLELSESALAKYQKAKGIVR